MRIFRYQYTGKILPILSKLYTMHMAESSIFVLLKCKVKTVDITINAVYQKIPIYRKFRYIGMTDKLIPINGYWFQYRYFRYIGIPNIPNNNTHLHIAWKIFLALYPHLASGYYLRGGGW
jgi:hypothetical protein